MTTRCVCFVLLAGLPFGPAFSGAVQDAPPLDASLAAGYFAEARGLNAQNPWRGSLYGPLLFVDPVSRHAVANQADAEGQLTAVDGVDGVWAGRLPEDVVIANTVMTWAGERWTMVMWPLPVGHHARLLLVGHELFHRLGPELGLPLTSPPNRHLDTAEGRTTLRLELRALVRALGATGADRTRAVQDVLTFRLRRYATFPSAAAEERALELNEGLAEYTGVRAALPAPARIGWVVRETESREVRARDEGITRSFAYATGPCYGLLLDASLPGWRARLTGSTRLDRLLAEAHGIEPAGLADRADNRMGAYDGESLLAFERGREERRMLRQAELRATFVDGPVLRLPADDAFEYAFDPNGVTTLDGVGQVLVRAELSGGWGTLNVTGGVLLERGDQGITGVVVPAPEEPTNRLEGPGWNLELAEGWEVVPGGRAGDWLAQVRTPVTAPPHRFLAVPSSRAGAGPKKERQAAPALL